jgi:DNA-binding response OmpR family regulator
MNRQILVIDDEQAVRDVVSLFLCKKGFDVQTAPSGSRAMELLDTAQFDLVILDGNLAGESGVDLLRVLKAKYTWMPVILFSGSLDAELSQKALAAGANALVGKTDSFRNLFAEISRHISS